MNVYLEYKHLNTSCQIDINHNNNDEALKAEISFFMVVKPLLYFLISWRIC